MKAEFENLDWKHAIASYENCKRILSLSAKVGSNALVHYASNQIADIRAKYPNVKFD